MRWSIHATIAIAAGAIILTMILCARHLADEMPSAYGAELELEHLRAELELVTKNTAEINDRLKTPEERFQDTIRTLETAEAVQEAKDRASRGEPFRP